MVAIAALAMAAAGVAADLKPGMPAPPLKVSEWIKGKPAPALKSGQVYVVEFWATWCGPCRTSIPHLTKLAKEHGDKVHMIGVSVWENGDDIPGQVKKFVKDMGEKMDYTVALDTTDGVMASTWMRAAGQNGIPAAFIVNREGKIAWIGHPMEMDEPLQQIVDGSFDLQASIAKFEAEMKADEERRAKMNRIRELGEMYKKGEKAQAIAELDKMIESGDNAMSAQMTKLSSLGSDDLPGLEKALDAMAVKGGNDWVQVAAQFAFSAASGRPANPKAAILAADKVAAKGGDLDWVTLYYLSHAYGKSGDKKKGHAMIVKALEKFEAENKKEPNPSADQIRDMFNKLKDEFSK